MPSGSTRPLEDTPILVGASYWALNGVNVFSANLVRGLLDRGLDACILLTEERSFLVSPTEGAMPRPAGIPFTELPVPRTAGWGRHWGGTVRFLRERSPCIWLPNSDYRHSCVGPQLPDEVMVVGVVHSDDPLHYDHAVRVGDSWNWATATSPTIASRVLESGAALEGRMTTIPIGVEVPEAPPDRARSGPEPLRVIYHGALKKYQKRVLDLVGIALRCAERGVPVTWTVAGGGPDEEELRGAARDLVAAGTMRFLGVVPHQAVFGLLEEHDVYVLTSAFEGMPNALLEAMGRGCVPVVTRMESGIPDVVRDGENGFVVPIGDLDAFADRLHRLHSDPEARRAMARRAHERVARGAYRMEQMVGAYVEVFGRVVEERRSGRFRRIPGPLRPPPAVLDGVSVFPVPLRHQEPGLGSFPSRTDALQYLREVHAPVPLPSRDGPGRAWQPRRRRARQDNVAEIVIGLRTWADDGLSEWGLDLGRGLRERGLEAHLLVTEEDTDLVTQGGPRRDPPADVPLRRLPVGRGASWGGRWGALVGYLEGRGAPCVYLPNDDYRHSCVTPILPPHVLVAGVVHSDDPLHREHVRRLGAYWNAVVAGSGEIAEVVEREAPGLAPRIEVISHGLRIPAARPGRERTRDLALLVIADAPPEGPGLEGGPGSLTSAGFHRRVTRVSRGMGREALGRAFAEHDAFLLTDWTAGDFPLVREGMGMGCVPLLAGGDPAGSPIVRPGWDGFHLDLASGGAVARVLGELAEDPALLEAIAVNAHESARERSFRTDDMAEAWSELFERIVREAADGAFRRPPGRLSPPPARVGGIDVFPVGLSWSCPDVGPFVSRAEALEFARELPSRHPVARRVRRALRSGE